MSNVDMRTSSSYDAYETPQWLVEEVRKFFGGKIDLDPCTSCRNPTGATYYETAETDGLSSVWAFNENAYVNSPYGRQLKLWSDKCFYESQRSDIEILQLVPARFGSGWFKTMAGRVNSLGVFNKRLTFEVSGKPVTDKNGRPQTAQFDTCLVYYGDRKMDFRRHFAPYLTFWKLG